LEGEISVKSKLDEGTKFYVNLKNFQKNVSLETFDKSAEVKI
jgi:hypothetical protein